MSDETTEQDVTTEARQLSLDIARDILHSDWYAESIAEAWRQGAAEVTARVEAALDDMATWCGPYGHQGVADFIDRRDQHLRLALRGDA